MAEHALLSPSSADRWIHCPPSVRLSEGIPNTDTPYSKAGTLAHSIAELKARKHFVEPMGARTYNARLKKLKADPDYDTGMDSATDLYLEELKRQSMEFADPPFVVLESRVDFSHLVRDGFGRADCLMMGGSRLVVVDYKNGAGVPVEAEENPQMMLYALGALHTYAPVYGDQLTQVRLVIVQPNAGGVKSWDTTRQELERWGENAVRPAAELAIQGKGEFNPDPNEKGWCYFCPAKAQCSARAAQMLEVDKLRPKSGEILTDLQVGAILTKARGLESWVHDLEQYALTTSLQGGHIPGWKVVEGRGSRNWIDQDNAFAQLQQRGVAEAVLYERKAVSVPGLEKALGKSAFTEAAAGLWVKNPGKPTLAADSDPRPVYQPEKTMFQPVNE